MLHKYLEIASTPAVKAARQHYGSAGQYARIDGTLDPGATPRNHLLGPDEEAFIAQRGEFYLASVSETGWPYLQFRGGPAGFLRVLDSKTLGFADFRGNRQYITTGNVAGNDRVSLFLMDYAHQRRLKIFGHMHVVDAPADTALAARLSVPGYDARVERAVTITIEGFDWNCPQHITPRYSEAELAEWLEPVKSRLQFLEEENRKLKERLASGAA
ncbi:pyridoxamine 5'-phosphate oxidase family protein [Bosea sp. BIWAKO-01]|uniref:pyridoxamine 5'-phosphate oxidase family protein n=1 Tax=Bosea sp. BIWAKO-01 TaxID=506668 RepID=UPI0008532541|nr:pyridoxamine 5'-phosphate oxidase family protein [Bosea sp. BIWAKO-01]GAU85705.1 flavodoxin reductases (ferredoxin-NADPH reductases) family 1 [Bosea sp. BIWAKO-01]